MERLRIAIERAREQRLADEAPAARATEAPAPARRTAAQRAAARAGGGVAGARVDAAWDALAPLPLLRRRAEIAPESGPTGSAYGLLRTRVLQQARRNGWRRVALVSPESGDGKTTMTANLAVGLTRQTDARAVVLDLDLRRIGLSRLLGGGEVEGGMEEVLSGEVPFAARARRLDSNVALGLNRHVTSRPGEILQSASAKAAIAAIEAELEPDLMLFDMPPLRIGEDNFAFLENADCALIVVAAESTPMSRIDMAERQVAELTEVMGVVLNKCRYPDPAYGYEA